MRTKRRLTDRFWAVLTTINVVAIIFPISLILSASTGHAGIIGMVVVVGIVLLLAIDTISILIAYL
jgi:hypothetical protein